MGGRLSTFLSIFLNALNMDDSYSNVYINFTTISVNQDVEALGCTASKRNYSKRPQKEEIIIPTATD